MKKNSINLFNQDYTKNLYKYIIFDCKPMLSRKNQIKITSYHLTFIIKGLNVFFAKN